MLPSTWIDQFLGVGNGLENIHTIVRIISFFILAIGIGRILNASKSSLGAKWVDNRYPEALRILVKEKYKNGLKSVAIAFSGLLLGFWVFTLYGFFEILKALVFWLRVFFSRSS